MRRTSTEKYLTLGMALTGDKKTMERRVRGVFGRKNSPRPVKMLALLLCIALGVGCFTTACKTATTPLASDGSGTEATNGNAATVSSGNATGGDATYSTHSGITKDDVMGWQAQEIQQARTFVAPRITDFYNEELGSWQADADADSGQQAAAAEAFLTVANSIFNTSYTADDLSATYYADKSGYRSNVWRFDSTDGVLAGALDADTLDFISADCTKEPSDTLHESLAGIVNAGETNAIRDSLDSMSVASRIADVFGGEVNGLDYRSGSYTNLLYGWGINQTFYFALGDGRYCMATIYADENLTPIAVGIYPDADCVFEDVFWRADLQYTENVSGQLNPQDFRKGEPGADDMPVEEAYAFYYSLVNAAGGTGGQNDEIKEPNATFYVDYSGVRENYWHIEGDYVTFDLTSQTKHMINMEANEKLGYSMELMQISYDDMGGQEYIDATKALFAALYGEDDITDAMVNAVYDYHYCTVDVVMSDDTSYEIMYKDGLIENAQFFAALDEGGWGTDPNWEADWIYVNAETGETFHMDW